jgi:hypothetical protein
MASGSYRVCVHREAKATNATIEIYQYELLDKLSQELLRPLSGIRAELSLTSIISYVERTSINDNISLLAVDPSKTADLGERQWPRTPRTPTHPARPGIEPPRIGRCSVLR